MFELRKIVILYSNLSSYTNACFNELIDKYELELLIYHWGKSDLAPFGQQIYDKLNNIKIKPNKLQNLLDEIYNFKPDVILTVGWMDKDYLKVCRHFKKQGVNIIAGMDTQWTGNLRQQFARVVSPTYLHSAIDVMWVAGERQRQFAYRLGFTGGNCISGWYSCDWPSFSKVFNKNSVEHSFLFVGRYIKRKGVEVLINAYRKYFNSTEKPWPLVCAGTGPYNEYIDSIPGVKNLQFVQPKSLPKVMADNGVFVLPSIIEPWGVVVHEATAAGMPLIVSSSSGAGVHLAQDGYNGYVFESQNIGHLKSCMLKIHECSQSELEAMSSRSFELSKQYTPNRWAKTLYEKLISLFN